MLHGSAFLCVGHGSPFLCVVTGVPTSEHLLWTGPGSGKATGLFLFSSLPCRYAVSVSVATTLNGICRTCSWLSVSVGSQPFCRLCRCSGTHRLCRPSHANASWIMFPAHDQRPRRLIAVRHRPGIPGFRATGEPNVNLIQPVERRRDCSGSEVGRADDVFKWPMSSFLSSSESSGVVICVHPRSD